MRTLRTITATFAAAAALLAPAAQAAPAPPALGISTQFAIGVWNLPCETLTVVELTPATMPAGVDFDTTLGYSDPADGPCAIRLNFATIRDAGATYSTVDSDARAARREHGRLRRADLREVRRERAANRRNAARVACAVAVHEGGHKAGLGHSDDRSNVMYPVTTRYAPCDTMLRASGY